MTKNPFPPDISKALISFCRVCDESYLKRNAFSNAAYAAAIQGILSALDFCGIDGPAVLAKAKRKGGFFTGICTEAVRLKSQKIISRKLK